MISHWHVCKGKIYGGLLPCLVLLLSAQLPSVAHAMNPTPLHIPESAFHPGMCKSPHTNPEIRLPVAHRRDVLLRRVPGQYVPGDHEQARRNPYVYFLELADLSDGRLDDGAIAFIAEHAVIFTHQFPKGLSRPEYIAQLPRDQQEIAQQTFDIFLTLHPILNVLIDACRPYPAAVTYGTDDEFDKIEAAKRVYGELARAYNNGSLTPRENPWEPGTFSGFIDPRANGPHVSYQAMNPLNFHEALPTERDKQVNKPPTNSDTTRHEAMRVVATMSNRQ